MSAQVQVQTQQAQEEKSDAMNTLSKFAIIAILVGIIICFYQVMILAVTTPIPVGRRDGVSDNTTVRRYLLRNLFRLLPRTGKGDEHQSVFRILEEEEVEIMETTANL